MVALGQVRNSSRIQGEKEKKDEQLFEAKDNNEPWRSMINLARVSEMEKEGIQGGLGQARGTLVRTEATRQ